MEGIFNFMKGNKVDTERKFESWDDLISNASLDSFPLTEFKEYLDKFLNKKSTLKITTSKLEEYYGDNNQRKNLDDWLRHTGQAKKYIRIVPGMQQHLKKLADSILHLLGNGKGLPKKPAPETG
jgi:hypothetical protein